MRRLAFLILVIGLGFAQFEDTEGRLSGCQEGCCASSGGAWDAASQDCAISDMGGNAYHDCESACLETAGRELESRGAGLNLCCAPALVLLCTAAASMRR